MSRSASIKTDAMVGGAAERLVRELPLSVLGDDAGVMGVRAALPTELGPVDQRPRCSRAAAAHLRELTHGRYELLPEWLGLLSRTNMRVPEELIPDLFDAAGANREFRPAVRAAAGPLGAWLARFDNRWDWAVSAWDLESDWQNGVLWQRLEALREMRSTNPARARELAAASIAVESSDVRREILECFHKGLSADDEAFLETMLDDRSSSVRFEAANLLVRIPGAQLRARMQARIQGRVKLRTEGLLMRKKVFDVELFDSVDAGMRRDGVMDKKAFGSTTMGERALWTMQVVALVEPSYWTREFSMQPAALIETAREGQWAEVLVDGWRLAARFCGALDWLEIFATESTSVKFVFDAMPIAARERVMLTQLEKDAALWVSHVPECCPHEWSVALTEAFLRAVTKNVPDSEEDLERHRLRSTLDAAALLANCYVGDVPSRGVFSMFAYTIRLRRAMREALGVEKDKE